jgi:hypothetical protein
VCLLCVCVCVRVCACVCTVSEHRCTVCEHSRRSVCVCVCVCACTCASQARIHPQKHACALLLDQLWVSFSLDLILSCVMNLVRPSRLFSCLFVSNTLSMCSHAQTYPVLAIPGQTQKQSTKTDHTTDPAPPTNDTQPAKVPQPV